MKAVVFHKPKDVRVENVKDSQIEESRDAIVRVTSTAICGSDLHIYNGLFPQFKKMTLGHEFMGIVEEVGSGVQNLKKGDRVVVPFPIACGRCWFCNHYLPTACETSNPEHYGPEGGIFSQKGGGLFGYTDLYGGYAGGQAEAVRVPFADYGPRKIPEGLKDEEVLFLSDILPTGWAAVDWAHLTGGETVVVFGCGPVGLMAQKAAWLHQAGRVIGIDVELYRLEMAKKVAGSETIHSGEGDPVKIIRDMTDGRGADVCIDAVGMEPNRGILEKFSSAVHLQRGSTKVLETALSSVRRGGVVSVVGVYGTDYSGFPLGQIVDKGIALRFGQAPVHNYIDHLMNLIQDRVLKVDDIISHVFPLERAPEAYEIFNKKLDGCVKVILKP